MNRRKIIMLSHIMGKNINIILILRHYYFWELTVLKKLK